MHNDDTKFCFVYLSQMNKQKKKKVSSELAVEDRAHLGVGVVVEVVLLLGALGRRLVVRRQLAVHDHTRNLGFVLRNLHLWLSNC